MPGKPRRYCAKFPCSNLAEPGSAYCRAHKPKPAPKETDPFYSSTAWKRFRSWYRARHPLCEECEKHGRIVPMAIVDHIVEIKDGGAPFSEDNVQSLCRSCHNKKTARESRLRRENHQVGTERHRADTRIVS
ncbi:HNH endonuclease signature motif containing protein [uncultured Desulfosarcina sp.]|uniref:HNH endonuclease signature motif containing protein n=1 Tax=uncultured Desulfosarcina sp. TaxID=218289 RepID=UPI0029C74098|nr:HNH endonuclease signature motif containing protein [uncultured Desulfosarcina sp.]